MLMWSFRPARRERRVLSFRALVLGGSLACLGIEDVCKASFAWIAGHTMPCAQVVMTTALVGA